MTAVINPLITNAGFNAAVAASGDGLQLEITHIQIGSSAYVLDPTEGSPDYNRVALVAPTETVAIAGGYVMDKGFRVDTLFPSWVAAPYNVCEIGFWAGDPNDGGTLFAIWAQATPIVQRNNIDYLASFGIALARVPDGSVSVVFDPELSQAIQLMAFHESDPDPHTQYVKKAGDTMTGALLLAPNPATSDNTQKAASTSWIRSAMAHIATAAGFAVLLETNGFIKLPSWLGGLIFQWGLWTSNPSPGVAVNVTFPIVFPTAILSLTVSASANNTSSHHAWFSGETAVSFQGRATTVSNSCRYIAVGY